MPAPLVYYFQPDTVLRSIYGGDTIQYVSAGPTGQSGPDITAPSITTRAVMDALGLWQGETREIFNVYTDVSNNVWLSFPSVDYSLIQPHLSTNENATLTTSPPTLTAHSYRTEFAPSAIKRSIMTIGDSITAGLGYGAANDTQTYQWQLLPLLKNYAAPIYDASTPTVTLEPSTNQQVRHYECRNYQVFNLGQGSASYANTSGTYTGWEYEWNSMVDQKIKTLPMPSAGENPYILLIWLGTNDVDYDSSQTAADVWTRATTFIDAVRARFTLSQMKIIMSTAIRRTNNAGAPNATLETYNGLIRSNYASIGVDALADIERNTVDNSGTYESVGYQPYKISTDSYGTAGDTTNLNYYNSDNTHPTAYGYTLIAPIWAAAINPFL